MPNAQRAASTERRLRHQCAALLAENAALSAALDRVPDLMFDLDEHGRYARVWARDPSLLAAQQDRLLGRTVEEVLPAEAAALCRAAIAEALACGYSSGTRIRLEVPAGIRHFELSVAASGLDPAGLRHVSVLSRDVTAQEEAQVGLRQALATAASAASFSQAVFDAAPSPSCVVDARGDVVAANRAWREFALANRGDPERLGNYLQVCDSATGADADAAGPMAEALRRILAGQLASHVQDYPCHGLEERWFRALVSPFAGERGILALVEHRDITLPSLLERRLLQAQQQARIGNWELNLATGKLWWSDEVFRIFESSPDQFNATYPGFLAAIHPEDRAAVDGAYQQSLATGAPYRITHRVLLDDGRVKNVEECCDSEFSPVDGRPVRSWGTAQDVTERVLAKERLAEAQRQAALGAWELDLRSQAVWWSDEQYRINGIEVGAPRDQQQFLKQVHPDDLPSIQAMFATVFATGAGTLDYRIIRPDGAVRHLHGTAKVTNTAQGQPLRVAGTNMDVTELRVREQQLAASVREKETLVREVHHRVKNNLQVVASLLYFHGKKVRDPAAAAVFDEARARLKAMALVHERLYRTGDVARIEVAGYVSSLVAELGRGAAGAAVEVRVHVDDEMRSLPADFVLPLGMLLCELLSNALKHAFEATGGGVITVDLKPWSGGLQLRVADNGKGLSDMAAWQRPKTFGLQLVHSLAEQMGARLEVRVDGGTEVLLSAPLSAELPAKGRE